MTIMGACKCNSNESSNNLPCYPPDRCELTAVGKYSGSYIRTMKWKLVVADWSNGMSVCCKLQVKLFANAGNGWPHRVLLYH